MNETLNIPLWGWLLFNGFVLLMLALDLGVFHRKSHAVGVKEALIWSAVWIGLALGFNAWIYFQLGPQPGLEFLTGYVVEKSLSIDNIFVFLMVFAYFKVPEAYKHKVLFWGILGALLFRAAFIFAGVALLEKFHWLVFLFGGFLILTGIKMAVVHGKNVDPEKNPLIRAFRRFVPMTESYEGDRFLVRRGGKLLATPLLLVLALVEFTDVVFALDSIPAVLAITKDPFIVYTSNVFAILGLRSLFFAIAGLMGLFRYLSYGLATILAFVGGKMIYNGLGNKFPIGPSLLIIVGILAISVLASVLLKPRNEENGEAPGDPVPASR